MQTCNNTIEKFLGAPKTVFVVPTYQRNYNWEIENCRQLFDDIIRMTKTGQTHFLGTICYKDYNSHERTIIDGQQRLASIMLLMKAIYDFDSNKGNDSATDSLTFKLHLNSHDDMIYQTLLDNSRDTIDEALTPAQKNSRVYQNYLAFYNMIDEYVANGGNARDILESLRALSISELEIQEESVLMPTA